MSEYEEEEAKKQGTVTKAVVVHGVSTNWIVWKGFLGGLLGEMTPWHRETSG